MSTLQTLTLLLLLQGILGHDPGVHIIGGSDCNEGEFPFMAALTYSGDVICGCSIINAKWVLTAAHCVYQKPLQPFQVEYGSVKRDSPEVKIVSVSQIVTHPEYHLIDNNALVNDIALLKVEPEIELSEHVQMVHLPEMGAPTPGNQMGLAIGWGFTSTHKSDDPNTLQKLEMPVLSEEECKDKLGTMYSPTYICVGTSDPDLHEDVYFGDSGSPILVPDVQVGIASFIDPRHVGPPYLPSVFTKVSLYIDWITETVNAN